MHIHILGICGTFMGGIASLAIAKGHRVTGSDENVYPPMSTQLMHLGIELKEGYSIEHLFPKPDRVIIGNALKRGNPAVEAVLNEGLYYQSGPQWLAENILQDRWVIGVAGTHGKTTTASMIAWILEFAGFDPGFLIGGIPSNFGFSAKYGSAPYFVVEADEYDSAFFDKRSKFVHYHPRTCVMNNLEFDHADIFKDLSEIQKQFHHLVRTIPGNGALILPKEDKALKEVLTMGCWSEIKTIGKDGEWETKRHVSDGSEFEVILNGKKLGKVYWALIGDHNVHNALSAIAATSHAGIPPQVSIEALGKFLSVKRRLEVRGVVNEITLYDDFAHHPTAIRSTLAGLRAKIGTERIIAILDIRSNTMAMGTHQDELSESLNLADDILVFQSPKVNFDVKVALSSSGEKGKVYRETQEIIDSLIPRLKRRDHVLMMSNGGFENLHHRLLQALQNKHNVFC